MKTSARRGPGDESRRGAGGGTAALEPEARAGAAPLSGFALLAMLVVIVLAMSPATRNLDNIKMALFLALGPLLLAAVAGEGAMGRLAGVRLSLPIGWAVYLGVTAASMAASAYRWAGMPELLFLWSCAGFTMAGAAMGASRSGMRVMMTGMSGLLLVVNLIGFAQFDLFDTGVTGVTLLQDAIWGKGAIPSGEAAGWQTLFYTFATSASNSLMSTILNRDFYAAFCLLFLGFPLALGWVSRRPGLKALGFGTAGLSLLSILLCQSKGEYIALAALGGMLPALLALAGKRPHFRSGLRNAWLVGAALLVGTILFVKSPAIGDQLKSLDHSLRSRLIIHRGAFNIFLDFPWLGGGPGTFKIYFPQYRSPDYFEWGISNVTNFAHNYFLDALSETGAAGCLALCALLGVVAIQSMRTIRREEDEVRVIASACLLACLAAFLISNLTSVSARWPIGAVGLWTVVGMLSGLSTGGSPAFRVPGGEGNGGQGRANRVHPWGGRRTVFLATLIPAVAALPFCLNYAGTYWRSQAVFGEGYLLAEQYRDFAIQKIYGGESLTEAEQAYLVERLNTAAGALRQAGEIDPTLISAFYHLGSTESLLSGLDAPRVDSHLEGALEAFERLAAYAPDYAELPYNLGIVHYQIAVRYQQVMENLPESSREARGRLMESVQHHQREAVKYFERMGELSQRSEVLLNLGESYGRVGRHDRARDTYRRGMQLDPGEARFPQRLFREGLTLGDEGAVIEAQMAMWRHEPLNLELVLGEEGALARQIGLGEREAFEAAAVEVAQRMPVDPRLYSLRARAARRWGSPEEMEREVERVVRLGGDAGAIRGGPSGASSGGSEAAGASPPPSAANR